MLPPLIILAIILDISSMNSLRICPVKNQDSSIMGIFSKYLCETFLPRNQTSKYEEELSPTRVEQSQGIWDEVIGTMSKGPWSPEADFNKEAKDVEKMFVWFSDFLNSFLCETGFEVHRFKSMLPALKRNMASIVRMTALVVLKHKQLQEQLKFVDLMFDTMIDAARTNSHDDEPRSAGYYYLKHIIDAHLALLAYFDSRGMPNSKRVDYVDEVRSIRDTIVQYDRNFATLVGVSQDELMLFRKHYRKAMKCTESLLVEK